MSRPEDGERRHRLGDEELVRLAAASDPDALAVLYDRHHVLAFSFAVRIVGPGDQAQEVVRAAFLTLWRDAGRYDPTRGLVRIWLMNMVHELGIDAVRRRSVRERRQAEAATREVPTAEGDLTSGKPYSREARAIREALRDLPEDERRIIELAFYGGWTQDEIADMLELPLDAVKSQARLGLLKLRDALLSELEAPP